jgi:hypothetical protein
MIGGDISELPFQAEVGPYVVEQDVVILPGTRVTIPAGCVFLFRPFTGMLVDGELIVQGTKEKPVVFTSSRDAAHGGDGSAEPPASSWNGIVVSAEGARLTASHARVAYSTYGIKAETDKVHLDQVAFYQNGAFHLTIQNKIHYVQQNVPYTWNFTPPEAAVTAPPAAIEETEAVPEEPARPRSSSTRKNIIRYSCLGVGVVLAGAGVFYSLQMSRFSEERQDYENAWAATPDPNAKAMYAQLASEADDNYYLNRAGAILTYGAGALCLIGFGVTFFF